MGVSVFTLGFVHCVHIYVCSVYMKRSVLLLCWVYGCVWMDDVYVCAWVWVWDVNGWEMCMSVRFVVHPRYLPFMITFFDKFSGPVHLTRGRPLLGDIAPETHYIYIMPK